MPQLKSGRHVGLTICPYLDLLATGTQEQRYFALVTLRLNAAKPEALLGHLVVMYFEGNPPDAPAYSSPYCAADIMEGRSDWLPSEVDEFIEWLTENTAFAPWLRGQFDDLNRAIQENSVWESPLMENDLDSDLVDEPMIKRAAIHRAALLPDAMIRLRSSRAGG